MKSIKLTIWMLLAALVTATSPALAQDIPEFETGLKPYGTYHGGDIDNVSLTNGNLAIVAPLWSYPQRGGKLNWDFSLIANAKNWEIKEHCTRQGVCNSWV